MPIQKLTIFDIIRQDENHLVLAINYDDLEMRKSVMELDINAVKNQFLNKTIIIVGKNIELDIEDAQVSSSIAEFKNIFLKIKKTPKTSSIKRLDEVLVNV